MWNLMLRLTDEIDILNFDVGMMVIYAVDYDVDCRM